MKKITFLLVLTFIVQLVSAQEKGINKDLFNAVKENNLIKVKELVKKGANVNAQDKDSGTLLMWAAFKGDLQLVKYLVSQKADCKLKGVIYTDEEKSGYYGNLMGIAAGNTKIDILKYFTEDLKLDINEREYNPETKQNDGWSPLIWAVSVGNNNTVNYLLEQGADPHAKNLDGDNGMHLALRIGNKKLFALLSSHSVRLDVENSSNQSPISLLTDLVSQGDVFWIQSLANASCAHLKIPGLTGISGISS